MNPQRWAWPLFFLSGLTGLIYEILWTRRLSLIFGHSVLAVSTVVTAFMAGLAWGSWLGGRRADRQLQAGSGASWFLRAYAGLETGVGLWGLLSLLLLNGVERVYFWLSGLGWSGTWLHLVVLLLSLLTLLPPTMAMGATLPLVSSLFREDGQGIGLKLSRLYSINTFGAALGAGLAGFLLLPLLGLRASVLAAALINLAIGGLAWKLAASSWPTSTPMPAPPPSSGSWQWSLPLLFGLGGFASMMFQLAWTRALAICLGSSVYAFSSILVVFLAGIAAGSSTYAWLFGRRPPQLQHLGWLFVALGVSGTASAWLLGGLPWLFVRGFPLVQGQHLGVLLLNFGLIALILGPPTLLMGVCFPLITEIYHRQSQRLGSSIGSIYGANTVGCILGSFLGGFFCLPILGVQTSIEVAAACNILGGGLCLLRSQARHKGLLAGLALALVLGNFLQPPWNQGLLMSGMALRPPSGQQPLPQHFAQPTFYRDGISCSVAMFVTDAATLYLKVNGKTDASRGYRDRQTQVGLGLLPLLYQPAPRRVGVIGLGSGMTLSTVAYAAAVEQAECAELEPAVVECDRYWAPFNRHVLQLAKTRIHVQDGRAFVLGSRENFDVIISEPSNPWIAGIGNLYTLEFYRGCRSKLNSHGVYIQWCNLYSLSLEDLKLVLNTFFTAFPYGAVWSTGGDVALVGSAEPLQCSLQALSQYYQSDSYLRHDLAELGLYSPEEFLGQYVCDRHDLLGALQGSGLNSDDLPVLEFSAPFSLYRPHVREQNYAWLLAQLQQSQSLPVACSDTILEQTAWGRATAFSYVGRLPQTWSSPASQAFFQMLQGAPGSDLKGAFDEVLKRYPKSLRARLEFARRAAELQQWEEVLHWLPPSLAAGAEPLQDYAAQLYRGQAAFQLQRFQESIPFLEAAFSAQPGSETASALAAACWASDQPKAAQIWVERSLLLNANDPRALFMSGQLRLAQHQPARALDCFRHVCQLCPEMVEAWLMRANLAAQLNLPSEAVISLKTAYTLNPADANLQAMLTQLEGLDPSLAPLIHRADK